MFYFKFQIPNNEDGSVCTYSPGWCGTRDRCALNEKGILYHDEERWGIGQAEGDFVPDDVEVLEEQDVIDLINGVVAVAPMMGKVAEGKHMESITPATPATIEAAVVALEPSLPESVYCGNKLTHRWDAKPEPEGASEAMGTIRMRHNTTRMATGIGFCGKCMKVRAFKGEVHQGLKAANVFLNGKCPVCETSVKAKVV